MMAVISRTSHCIAIGEVGLDYLKTTSPEGRRAQREFLEWAGRVAHSCKKPIVLHIRGEAGDSDAVHTECMDILGGVMDREDTIQIHCFTGSVNAVTMWKRRFPLVVFGLGPLICKDDKEMERMVARIEMSSMLRETDTPCLSVFNV